MVISTTEKIKQGKKREGQKDKSIDKADRKGILR